MVGAPVSFSSGVLLRSVIPYVLGSIPTIGWVFGLANVLWIFSGDRRCLHDHIAGTQVVLLVRA